MKIISEDEVLKSLRRKQGHLSLRQFAESMGISAAYLSDVYNKNRQPGKKLLKTLGLCKQSTRTVTYFEQ
jgi:transcriptional regulator with XRE-family HTH domain